METQTTKNTTLLILGSGAHNIYRDTHEQLDPLFDTLILDKDGDPDDLAEHGIPGKLFRNDTIEELFPDDNMTEAFTKAHHIIAGYILETAGIQK